MQNATCSIMNGETVDLLNEIALLCEGRRASTPRDLKLSDKPFKLMVVSPDVGMLDCEARLDLDAPIAFNPQNSHLVTRLRDGAGGFPVVIDMAQKGLFSVSVFPVHFTKLTRHARASRAA